MKKYAIAPGQKSFFDQHHYIEFEGLLPPEQCESLRNIMVEVLSNRLQVNPAFLASCSSSQLLSAGRDLWRAAAPLRQLVCNHSLASVAAELLTKDGLRLGYDMLLPAARRSNSNIRADNKFWEGVLSEKNSLAQMSCINPVVGGYLICLGSFNSDNAEGVTSPAESIWPVSPGNAIFVNASLALDLPLLKNSLQHDYLLICYCQLRSLYRHNDKDPHQHELKKRGYVFGDLLRDKDNPVLVR